MSRMVAEGAGRSMNAPVRPCVTAWKSGPAVAQSAGRGAGRAATAGTGARTGTGTGTGRGDGVDDAAEGVDDGLPGRDGAAVRAEADAADADGEGDGTGDGGGEGEGEGEGAGGALQVKRMDEMYFVLYVPLMRSSSAAGQGWYAPRTDAHVSAESAPMYDAPPSDVLRPRPAT